MTETGDRRILRWRGILSHYSERMRVLAALMIMLISTSQIFMQMGFVAVTPPSAEPFYLILTLLPVTVGSLLLGPIAGTALGLATGGVLFAHSNVMPLDFHEMLYITPFSSVVMLAVCGFFSGIFFALALRKDPPTGKRIRRILIICIIVSWVYSIAFALNALGKVITSVVEVYTPTMAEETASAIFESHAQAYAQRMGDVWAQGWADAGLVAAICIIVDAIARYMRGYSERAGVRSVFGIWLFYVVVLVFTLTSAVSFVNTTVGERLEAEVSMSNEVNYLSLQIDQHEKRMLDFGEVLDEFQGDAELTADQIDKIIELGDPASGLLDGYDVASDGLVIIAYDGFVRVSDDPRLETDKPLSDYLRDEILKAIETSVATGRIQRILYDGVQIPGAQEESAAAEIEIAYLYAQTIDDDDTIIIIRPSSMVYKDRLDVMWRIAFTTLLTLIAVFILVFRLLNDVVARRIDETNQALAEITAGDLDVRVEVTETREFRSLSEGINSTVDALKGWIAEALTRMDSELAAARSIQESALPRTFPPFPEIDRFDVYASMNPAREVGGDFYDFFLVGDDCTPEAGRLGFIVADVSGKGIPAALFMMKAKSEIHDNITRGMSLADAVTDANRKLCDGNDSGMFVTAWVGILDYATGHVEYVNAGHNPPLLQHDGSWTWLKEKSGMPLGLFDLKPYELLTLDCSAGDTFLLYSDGVTEAMDVNDELYGDPRLEELAKRCSSYEPRELLEAVRDDVAAFAEGAEQSDDITILTLKLR